MSSPTLESGISPTAVSRKQVRFLANLSEGLHAMAQPLTILRSSVPASAMGGIDTLKQRRYFELSRQQVERACSLFELLQDLVIEHRTDADCAPIELAELLTEIAEDQRIVLQASGIELRIAIPNGLLTVIGDEIRTLQAVQSALKTVVSVSAAGDVVEFLASACGRYVELIIRNDREHGRSLNSSERLSISLSQENILSQQGKYEYSEDPFCTRMALPMPHQESYRRLCP